MEYQRGKMYKCKDKQKMSNYYKFIVVLNKKMESGAPEFKHNDIIWAKVTGHPWWPGVVNFEEMHPNCQLCRVDFFGVPPTHSLLPFSKIIKYGDYQKLPISEICGRPSPALKRAISEASILFNTLQQSKNSPINRALTTSCPFEVQNTITSASKSEQQIYHDSKQILKDLQFQSSSQILQPSPKQKKIKKRVQKVRQLKIKKEQEYNPEILTLLKEYKLDKFTDVYKQSRKQNQQEINIKVNKLLFKIGKKYLCRERAIQFVLQNQRKINNLKELRSAIERIKRGAKGMQQINDIY